MFALNNLPISMAIMCMSCCCCLIYADLVDIVSHIQNNKTIMLLILMVHTYNVKIKYKSV